ncbi:MAG: ferritin [Bacteroidales bacterium]|nr:ferritin [Bacteroidales bacterium]
MLNNKIEKILNEQVEKEGYSSSLYLAMASWAEVNGYAGIAAWLYKQSDEERQHMLKLIGYINERGGHAIVPAFKEPPAIQKSVLNMFEEVLRHEQYISQSINEIVALCLEEKDFTTHNWIQWFVTEQIEEEAQSQKILDKLSMLNESSLYVFDRDIMSLRNNG